MVLICVFKHSFDPVFKYSSFLFPNVSVFKISLVFRCSCFPVFLFSIISVFLFQINLFADVLVFQHFCVFVSDAPVFRGSCFPVFLFSSLPVFLFQIILFSDVPVFQCSCFSVPVV